MAGWYKEEYAFKIKVLSVGPDGNPRHCRNGHTVGDTYTCGYGCPGGFCSKSMAKAFPLMEAVRAGGDLSNLLYGASKHCGRFTCPDGVVTFELQAYPNKTYIPVPITEATRQAVTDFIVEHWGSADMIIRGEVVDMTRVDGFAMLDGDAIVGLITYRMQDGVCEITSLDSVITGQGNGGVLLQTVVNLARERDMRRVQLITTNDNINAIGFYQKRGFDLRALNLNAIDRDRALKPEIPLIGETGIPLRHEVELVMEL